MEEKFKYIWITNPIDFFYGATLANNSDAQKVLNQMVEVPRDEEVYVVYMPYDGCFVPLYICKADNNGTTYLFSDHNIFEYYLKTIIEF